MVVLTVVSVKKKVKEGFKSRRRFNAARKME
jgi:hypothetical protein